MDNVEEHKSVKDLPLTAWHGTAEIEPNGEMLPWLSPGVGHDSTAQGDKAEKLAEKQRAKLVKSWTTV